MAKIARTKNEFSTCIPNTDLSTRTLLESLSSKPSVTIPSSTASADIRDTVLVGQSRLTNAPECVDASPSRSVSFSVYLDENLSTRDSLKCQEFDCVDNEEVSAVNSVEGKSSNGLCISEDLGRTGLYFKELNLLHSLFLWFFIFFGTVLSSFDKCNMDDDSRYENVSE